MNAECGWTIYRTRFLVRARQLTEPMAFTDALGREQRGQAGDYLVEDSGGIRRITSRRLFEDIYVSLTALPDSIAPDSVGFTGSLLKTPPRDDRATVA